VVSEYQVVCKRFPLFLIYKLLQAYDWCDIVGFDWNLVFKWDFMTSEEIAQRSSNVIVPIRLCFDFIFIHDVLR